MAVLLVRLQPAVAFPDFQTTSRILNACGGILVSGTGVLNQFWTSHHRSSLEQFTYTGACALAHGVGARVKLWPPITDDFDRHPSAGHYFLMVCRRTMKQHSQPSVRMNTPLKLDMEFKKLNVQDRFPVDYVHFWVPCS